MDPPPVFGVLLRRWLCIRVLTLFCKFIADRPILVSPSNSDIGWLAYFVHVGLYRGLYYEHLDYASSCDVSTANGGRVFRGGTPQCATVAMFSALDRQSRCMRAECWPAPMLVARRQPSVVRLSPVCVCVCVCVREFGRREGTRRENIGERRSCDASCVACRSSRPRRRTVPSHMSTRPRWLTARPWPVRTKVLT